MIYELLFTPGIVRMMNFGRRSSLYGAEVVTKYNLPLSDLVCVFRSNYIAQKVC
jgi:hypothetical protein